MPVVKFTSKQVRQIRRRILAWHRVHRRDLPWRRSRDPYRIWLAEVMLQQTRIAAVVPYYERFLARFTTVAALARARESEVLKLWAGLGYYSRARNLHRAAKEIIRRHAGKFPRELEAALSLPGIGTYTAAAILSIAYDVPLAALDGNVARVVARLFAFPGNFSEPRSKKQLAAAAQTLLLVNAPGMWNEALMELGETICTPRAPQCQACPVRKSCRAYARGLVGQLPKSSKKLKSVPMRIAAAILLDAQNRALLTKHPGAHDAVLFSRLWQFPAAEVPPGASPAQALASHVRSAFGIETRKFIAVPPASHAVTFRKLSLLPFIARVPRLPRRAGCRNLPLVQLNSLPVSSATRKIARAALAVIAP